MKSKKRLKIEQANGGYLAVEMGDYGDQGQPNLFTSFADAIEFAAGYFEETAFATTVVDAATMATSLQSICEKVIAPKLLAIEAKVNPGIENVVDTF